MKVLSTIFFCTLYAILNVAGAALIKSILRDKKLSSFNEWISFLLDYKVIIAFGLIFISALVMFKALGSANFSVVVPIATGINFCLTIVAGYFIFKDNINFMSVLGFLLILCGIVIISLSNHQHAS
ncbi:MAG: hypothetical protein ABIN36_06495 [Ferruginibacter sp.]